MSLNQKLELLNFVVFLSENVLGCQILDDP